MAEEQRDSNAREKPLHPLAEEYLKELITEREILDPKKHASVIKLLNEEIRNVEESGRAPPKEPRYIQIHRKKPIQVMKKVIVPVKRYPSFNFVGKLLGPKGNSLRRLQEETQCRILILGQGSLKDPVKEQRLKNSQELKYSHFNEELHVEISAYAPPEEAHAQMAYALAEIKKYLIPDKTDEISLQQMAEMEELTGQRFSPSNRFKREERSNFQNMLDKAHMAINTGHGVGSMRYERNNANEFDREYSRLDKRYN